MKKNVIEIPVDEYSSPIRFSASPSMKVLEVSEIFDNNSIRHLPVLKANKPVGIISERDIFLLDKDSETQGKEISNFMKENPFCVQSGTPLESVAFEMSNRKIGSAIVINDRKEAEAIFTSIDGLNAIIEVLRGEFEAQ